MVAKVKSNKVTWEKWVDKLFTSNESCSTKTGWLIIYIKTEYFDKNKWMPIIFLLSYVVEVKRDIMMLIWPVWTDGEIMRSGEHQSVEGHVGARPMSAKITSQEVLMSWD